MARTTMKRMTRIAFQPAAAIEQDLVSRSIVAQLVAGSERGDGPATVRASMRGERLRTCSCEKSRTKFIGLASTEEVAELAELDCGDGNGEYHHVRGIHLCSVARRASTVRLQTGIHAFDRVARNEEMVDGDMGW